ncbi:unnamed protein product [Hydatigera taeniaeformis]|uniref:Secreted protein n=1 Tax=Hydatigena taeniaeformis TaxID=6205 RepID=A0A0R3WNS0_HYDTA|nr:unnamed protein product [Hydatigera taeniaeformis]
MLQERVQFRPLIVDTLFLLSAKIAQIGHIDDKGSEKGPAYVVCIFLCLRDLTLLLGSSMGCEHGHSRLAENVGS